MKEQDVTVIGGGPAGLRCGAELASAGARVLVAEAESLGGQLASLTTVRETPDGEAPRPAWDLVELALDDLERAGGEVELERVTRIAPHDGAFELSGDRLGDWSSQAVVIATGSATRRLDVGTAATFEGKGVSYCADCDGPLFAGRTVALVGEGRLVAWEGLALAEFCDQVFALDCSPQASARDRNRSMLSAAQNVSIHPASGVTGVAGDGRVEAITFHTPSGDDQTLAVDAVFSAFRDVGARPDLTGLADLDSNAPLMVGSDLALTGVTPGAFVIGDARSPSPGHLLSALGDAVLVTESVLRHLGR